MYKYELSLKVIRASRKIYDDIDRWSFSNEHATMSVSVYEYYSQFQLASLLTRVKRSLAKVLAPLPLHTDTIVYQSPSVTLENIYTS